MAATKELMTPEPTPTEPACTSLPEGMTLQVETNPYGTVRVEVEGLLSGEKPLLLLILERENRSIRTEVRPSTPVEWNGRFEWTNNFGMEMMEEPSDGPWQGEVKIVHSRGVACEKFTLP